MGPGKYAGNSTQDVGILLSGRLGQFFSHKLDLWCSNGLEYEEESGAQAVNLNSWFPERKEVTGTRDLLSRSPLLILRAAGAAKAVLKQEQSSRACCNDSRVGMT